MRKITFLFAALLMCVSAVRVSAQGLADFGLTPILKNDADTTAIFSSTCADKGEGLNFNAMLDGNPDTYWHTDWRGEVKETHHFLDINLSAPLQPGDYVLYLHRRNINTDHPTVLTLDYSNDEGKTWNPVDTLRLPFSGKAQGDCSYTWTLKEATQKLRLTVLDCLPKFRKYWHTAELEIYKDENSGAAMFIMNKLLTKYDAHISGSAEEQLNIGTEPGQYADGASYEQFKVLVQYASDLLSGMISDILTATQAYAKVEEAEALYKKVMDSKVEPKPYKIANGFYRIIAQMEYTETIKKPILDENGDTIKNPDTGQPEVENITTHPLKAMCTNGNKLIWKTYDEKDCNFLFRFDETDTLGQYFFYAAAGNGRLDTVATSKGANVDPTLDPKESRVALSYNRHDTINNRDVLVLARADQNKGYTLLHQGGNASGAGKSGDIVGWRVIPATEWYLLPVDEVEAQKMIDEWNIAHNRETMLADVARMVSTGKEALVIAHDIFININREQPLVTAPTQFSSPVTTIDGQTEPEGGVYAFLLDGNHSTYWHSRWEDGIRPAGTHYLQVELTDPASVQSVAIEITRRAAANDHVTEWGVFGTNVADAEKSACDSLDIIYTPFANNTETVASMAFATKGHKYLRFYINNTVGSGISKTRGYGHVSEFQLYPATNDERPGSQMLSLGELYTNLEAAIKAVPAVQDEITRDHHTALKAAYDAFMAKYVDPRPLRNAIEVAIKTPEVMVIGTEPGKWNEGATADLEALIAAAKVYDEAGKFTKEQTDGFIAQLDAEKKNFFAKANKVDTNKWYYIRIADEALYDERKWSKGNVIDEKSGLGNLFGQYVASAIFQDPEGSGPDNIITVLPGEEVREGTRMHFTSAADAMNESGQFRFIAQGDTAYTIQHRATGLYINCAGANNQNVSLGLNPSIFKVRAVGYGQMVFGGNSLTGANLTFLHAQKAHHRLVTWRSQDVGSNSAMFVEEAEAIDPAMLSNFVRDVRPGKVTAQCYPVGVSTDEAGMYVVAGTYTEADVNYVALNAVNSVKAGEPFIFIHGATTDYTEPAEGEQVVTEPVLFKAGLDLTCVADSANGNGLIGTFVNRQVAQGTVVFAKNGAEGVIEGGAQVAAHGAFLVFGTTEVVPGTGDIQIEIVGEVNANSIQDAIENVAKKGNVYDMNGRLVRTNATLNEVKALGRGMYILNGTKVLVK